MPDRYVYFLNDPWALPEDVCSVKRWDAEVGRYNQPKLARLKQVWVLEDGTEIAVDQQDKYLVFGYDEEGEAILSRPAG